MRHTVIASRSLNDGLAVHVSGMPTTRSCGFRRPRFPRLILVEESRPCFPQWNLPGVYDAHKMRELHGIVSGDRLNSQEDLKRYLILFDKLRVVWMGGGPAIYGYVDGFTRDLEYLSSKGIIVHVTNVESDNVKFHPSEIPISPSLRQLRIGDILVRHVVAKALDQECDVAGIYTLGPCAPLNPDTGGLKGSSVETALSVGLGVLPTPDETSALEDIFNFKNEMRDKRWGFRRFIKTLATKQQTESEIQDEIEWMLNEYSNAMKIHHLKASQSFFEVYILPVIEIAENLAKFNWSKIAKGALDVRKRKIELLEAEMKAPGRECAYVFDARKRFGG